ncbi:RagB/SusD family nutrient uptake outer membrane protein [Flavivirga rizhaonensis]|uniref:RagB/SusD family nutrient uptake outer membrane protein n=1 Tax=Flavivirga rizhaonensis TaxID=2559571 RepID=A0A4S1DYF9_9FLAO|nr:RagB/SusD family nutrient uptake outer membrane protein [Flavivirga rizhaonensis]TGV02582.1 RagB/SusD family nutrient uptake outer membrane protein [Flavivirga rizhaonensis]
MKKIYIILLVFLSISCEDYLEKEPQDSISELAFYKSTEDFELLSNAMYAPLPKLQFRPMLLDAITPYIVFGNNVGSEHWDFGNLNVDALWNATEDFWKFYYQIISRANLILANIDNPDLDLSQSFKDRVKGEALFLRGFSYFYLINLYGNKPYDGTATGGVPLILEPQEFDDAFTPKSSVDVVYAQIEEDLISAQALLPSVQDYRGTALLGKASKGAAQTMLGKAYLFQGKWSEAATELEKVVASNDYDLLSNFNDNFWPEHDNSIESIFEIQYQSGVGLGSIYNQAISPIGSGGISNSAWFKNQPTPLLVDKFQTLDGYDVQSTYESTNTNYLVTDYLGNTVINGKEHNTVFDIYNFTSDDPGFDSNMPFENRDPRFDYTVMYIGSKYVHDKFETRASKPGYYIPFGDNFWRRTNYNAVKYIVGSDYAVSGNDSPKNLHYLRYSDVLLMLAEAKFQLNDIDAAVANINTVRDRVGMLHVDTSLTLEDILDDRIRELIMEAGGHVYFDTKRYGTLKGLMENFWDGTQKMRNNYPAITTFEDYFYTFPIPQKEILANPNLEQNPGY